jgi:hypothetical protein
MGLVRAQYTRGRLESQGKITVLLKKIIQQRKDSLDFLTSNSMNDRMKHYEFPPHSRSTH